MISRSRTNCLQTRFSRSCETISRHTNCYMAVTPCTIIVYSDITLLLLRNCNLNNASLSYNHFPLQETRYKIISIIEERTFSIFALLPQELFPSQGFYNCLFLRGKKKLFAINLSLSF